MMTKKEKREYKKLDYCCKNKQKIIKNKSMLSFKNLLKQRNIYCKNIYIIDTL